MNREIFTHCTNAANAKIKVFADERDENNGNASHLYTAVIDRGPDHKLEPLTIGFQNGPIGEVGINGITNEVLLAIVQDRLDGFQSSPYACEENAKALTAVKDALYWLESRTKAREARGVEGTHQI